MFKSAGKRERERLHQSSRAGSKQLNNRPHRNDDGEHQDAALWRLATKTLGPDLHGEAKVATVKRLNQLKSCQCAESKSSRIVFWLADEQVVPSAQLAKSLCAYSGGSSISSARERLAWPMALVHVIDGWPVAVERDVNRFHLMRLAPLIRGGGAIPSDWAPHIRLLI